MIRIERGNEVVGVFFEFSIPSLPPDQLPGPKRGQLELTGTVKPDGRGRVGTTPLTTASLRVSGFQDKGAIWIEELDYFSIPTDIRHQAHADHPNMFRVVYPDGTLSADCYNLARVKQHCRDIARAIYPRQPPGTSRLPKSSVAGAPSNAAHWFGPRDAATIPPNRRDPKGPLKGRPDCRQKRRPRPA
jgi:hypothetical protein